jgi:serine/threonine protein phosphatase PrpC
LGSQASITCEPGTLLADRYWCTRDRIFLDTKPGLLPECPKDISATVEPYLHLIANKPLIPQVYAVLPYPTDDQAELILLEQAPIYSVDVQLADRFVSEGELMPALTTLWPQSSGFRQLNWLWQLAQLWPPLQQEKVTQTLLIPTLIRVEGGLVRLLELYPDPTPVSLAALGSLWQGWAAQAHPEITDFLEKLCEQLITGQIVTADHLLAILDQAIAACSQTQQYQMQVATLTDQGPIRQLNEDACFPESGSVSKFGPTTQPSASPANLPLAIVCDGIGGHEGGEVASNLAIATLQQQLQHISSASPTDINSLTQALEEATLTANDAIFQRNDSEQRQERQRMGTTLVMALNQGHAVYITHVGDSRAYRITPMGCHQMTVDDDLAVREVRLGYSLYRDAVQQPSAGSLVQALGMGVSSMLRPTVQRFLVDEDCVFLLCSDGLSDNDRVEENWQAQILPLLNGALDLATVAQRLVAIANQQNGHDNVTVALLHCRVTANPTVVNVVPATLATQAAPVVPTATAPSTVLKTKNLPPPQPARRFSLLTGFLLAIGLGGLATYGFIQGIRWFEQGQTPIAVSPPLASPSLPPPPPPLPNSTPPLFAVGTRILVNRATPAGDTSAPLALLPRPMATPDPQLARAQVFVGSVLEVISQRADAANQRWLGVKVCSTTGKNMSEVQPGALGWMQEATIAPFVTANVSLTPAQLGVCAASPQPLETRSPNAGQ